MSLEYIHQLDKAHIKTQVRFVTAIIFHGISPWHADKRLRKLHTAQFLEQVLCHTFKKVDDVVLFHKTHFAVYLRKLRLPVGTQVFVSETLHYLEITVHAAHHQQLLKSLRALGESIELAWVHAAWYHKIASTFGS